MIEPVRRSVHVDVAPEVAFRVFTERFGDWWPVASHSAISAPVMAPGTEIRIAANTDGRAAGNATLNNASRSLPP